MPPKKAAATPKWVREQLGLTPEAAESLVKKLTAKQLLVETGSGKKRKVGINHEGREQLELVQEFIPRPLTEAELKANELRGKVAALHGWRSQKRARTA